MERRFRHDFGQVHYFGQVKVHADDRAADSAAAVGALAYTVGDHVVFGRGQYDDQSAFGQRLLAHELTHVVEQDQTLASTQLLQRFVIPLPEELVDNTVQRSLERELGRYRNIPVDVQGFVPVAGPMGQTIPVPITLRVQVQAAYFINTQTAREHYADARTTANFAAIIRALRGAGEFSVIEGGGGGRRTAGRAVELGKATPDDLRLFIAEAVSQGVIRDYAIAQEELPAGQQLVDLGPDRLQQVIQDWVYHVGVGVDCSGFVLYAAARARQAVREQAEAYNWAFEQLGLGIRYEVPPELGLRERSAQSFTSGPRVESPSDIRPGDSWVMTGGGHVRIVTAVREVTLDDGGRAIEFDTAESSGTSTSSRPGPVGRTWRTRSRDTFHPIIRVGGGVGDVTGTFHRIDR